MNTQPILAFDVATMGGSVALMVDGSITQRRIGQTAQAAELLPAMDGLLRDAGLSYGSIGSIVSTVGPGSFTGVRIGLAALHGLVLVHQTPIKMLTTLGAMAWAIAEQPQAPTSFHVALRAGKGEIYTQAFSLSDTTPAANSDITLMPETYSDWDAPCFGSHVAAGDARFLAGPDAASMCRIADHLPTTSLAEALPVYIRPPDAIVGAPLPWLVRN